MSTTAPGVGGTVARVTAPRAPTLGWIHAMRLSGRAPDPSGGRDPNGFSLHVIYRPRRDVLRAGSDDVTGTGAPATTPGSPGPTPGTPGLVPPYEFEANGGTILPWCGSVALTGGSGPWSWEVRMDDDNHLMSAGNYVPTWRSLTQYVQVRQTFEVPRYHTRIGVLNGTATVQDVETGLDVTLTQVGAPCDAGQQFMVTGEGLLVFFQMLL